MSAPPTAALPCPWCNGKTLIGMRWLTRDIPKWWGFCTACQAKQAESATEEEAIENWNRRATPAVQATADADEAARKIALLFSKYNNTGSTTVKWVNDFTPIIAAILRKAVSPVESRLREELATLHAEMVKDGMVGFAASLQSILGRSAMSPKAAADEHTKWCAARMGVGAECICHSKPAAVSGDKQEKATHAHWCNASYGNTRMSEDGESEFQRPCNCGGRWKK